MLFFLPAMLVFLKLGADYFWKSFQQNERIVTSPWLPIVWPFKFVMPLTAALLIIQGIVGADQEHPRDRAERRCSMSVAGPRRECTPSGGSAAAPAASVGAQQ